jgi:hypothetical protein
VARRVEIEFVGDRLAEARLAQPYVSLAPERSRVSSSGVVGQSTIRRGRVAAIYARVSSDRQRREQPIQSQTLTLRELAAERGLLVSEDLVFEDEGASVGAALPGPGATTRLGH